MQLVSFTIALGLFYHCNMHAWVLLTSARDLSRCPQVHMSIYIHRDIHRDREYICIYILYRLSRCPPVHMCIYIRSDVEIDN